MGKRVEDDPARPRSQEVGDSDKPAGGEPYNEEAYKQSGWADLIFSVAVFAGATGNLGMAEWAVWMKREGFRLSGDEIGAKARELFGLSQEEQEAMVKKLVEQMRRERDSDSE